jgi:anti-sigma factor ChrR (cupin superfamily)
VGAERVLLQDLFAGLHGRDWSALPWQPFRTGIEIVRLYGDGQSGPAAALLRYAPETQLPPHTHVDYEHIVVLSGSQQDDQGVYGVGSVLIHGPGTGHGVRSEDGCVVLAIWNAPVRFEPT